MNDSGGYHYIVLMEPKEGENHEFGICGLRKLWNLLHLWLARLDEWMGKQTYVNKLNHKLN